MTSSINWDSDKERESLIHRIHSYPAKFPAFITTKALHYAERQGIRVRTIADVFCGCGTTAVEARKNDKNFWGCDINPVATLIAQVKSRSYKQETLQMYYAGIRARYYQTRISGKEVMQINDRIKYWFEERNIEDLLRLKKSIIQEIPYRSPYRKFFLCAFSNILKLTSRWLTKSIKSQIDPHKPVHDVFETFERQFSLMEKASAENIFPKDGKAYICIENKNFLKIRPKQPSLDLIVTSPPYVSSYDYADIHQLSALWLDYVSDYRELRKGMMGNRCKISIPSESDIDALTDDAKETYKSLLRKDKAKARATARYFVDLRVATTKCFDILKKQGMIVFVIGDTEYKGVKIDNVKFLAASMEDAGFQKIDVMPRKVSRKNLTPYRDSIGRFVRKSGKKTVYEKEFIVIGRRP